MLRILAPAKVNLVLRVLAREASGYHQLETVFLGLEFGDVLSVALKGRGISLTVEGPLPGPTEENLVYRAARAFLTRAGIERGVELHLSKRIPTQGGLGGGSSDAAATLKALSALLPGSVERQDLWDIAGALGSDVPFFLSPSPRALAWGRGERILPLSPLPQVAVILAAPPLRVSTPEAFRSLAEERSRTGEPRRPGCLHREGMGRWEETGAGAENDFEPVIFRRYPLLGRIRAVMEEQSPRLSLLSGTGASLFAVFETREEAEAAKTQLEGTFPDVPFILTRNLRSWPEPTYFQDGVEGNP